MYSWHNNPLKLSNQGISGIASYLDRPGTTHFPVPVPGGGELQFFRDGNGNYAVKAIYEQYNPISKNYERHEQAPKIIGPDASSLDNVALNLLEVLLNKSAYNSNKSGDNNKANGWIGMIDLFDEQNLEGEEEIAEGEDI